MTAIGRGVPGYVPPHRAPIDRGATHHAPTGREAIVNDQRTSKADPRANENAMKRDGNLEKANVTIRTRVNAKPPAIAKNRPSRNHNRASADRLNLAPPVHFAFNSASRQPHQELSLFAPRL